MRYFLEIAYQGTRYSGWQIQQNAHSLQAAIEEVLSVTLREKISLTASGRTDTGVHAHQQFAHFDCSLALAEDAFVRKWNSMLSEDIAILNLLPVHDKAHARFDAIARTYHYYIVQQKTPLLENRACLDYRPLDLDRMNEASQKLLLHKDFESFSRPKANVKNFQCDISEAYWEKTQLAMVGTSAIKFSITSNRFLWGMVRAIVGTLLDVGTAKKTPEEFEEIIVLRNRQFAGTAAPAEGLYLAKVAYDLFDAPF